MDFMSEDKLIAYEDMPDYMTEEFLDKCFELESFLNSIDENIDWIQKMDKAVYFYYHIWSPMQKKREGRQGASESSVND